MSHKIFALLVNLFLLVSYFAIAADKVPSSSLTNFESVVILGILLILLAIFVLTSVLLDKE